MGWCSGTEIFDAVCSGVLSEKPKSKKAILQKVIMALEDLDWDCQSESEFFEHPLVQEIIRELHPTWFDGV